MTQVGRYGHMTKVHVSHAKVHVTGNFKVHGSVLRGDVQSEALGFDIKLELESSEPEEKLAKLVDMAEKGCFMKAALENPTPVNTATTINGKPLRPYGEE